MSLTLAQLRTAEGVADIRTRLITNLSDAGLPVDDWAPSSAGGVENLRADMVAGTLAELTADRVAQLVELTLLELATGDRLTYLALHRYKLARDPATYTIQNVALWLVGGSAKTFNPGDLMVKSQATGNQYRNIDAVALTPANTALGPANVRFQAENPGSSYSDPAGTIAQMVTAPAGVRCINKRPGDFTDAKVNGASTGTISAQYSVPDVSPSYGAVRVRIDSSGEINTATFSYSTDGGGTWVSGGALPTTRSIPGGTTLFFSNGVAPSFIVGNIFTLLVSDAILQRGADQESAAALKTRCRNRWSSLSDVPTESVVDLWAHLASPEVDKVLADADPNTPGSMLVRIASASGPASAQAVIAVQDYVSARLRGFKGVAGAPGFTSPEEKCLVTSASKLQVTPYAVVSVPIDTVTDVQAAAETAWTEYLRDVPLGGSVGAVVRLEKLVQVLMDAGAIDVQGETLNSAAANITLADGEKAVPADGTTLLTALVWTPDASGTAEAVEAVDDDEAASSAAAADLTLSGILSPPSAEEVGANLLSFLGTAANPVTDWNSGAVLRTMYEIEKDVIEDLASAVQIVAAGGFPDTGEDDWLTDLARAWYGIDRSTAEIAQQALTLACTADAGPYTITAERLDLEATDGAAYTAATGGTLNSGDTLDIDARAISPGAARGLINRVVTPLRGVTVVTAAIKVISTVSQFGADEEGDTSLAARCDARWPSLEDPALLDRVEKWARAAHEDVTRVRLYADPDNAGGVLVTVAGVDGAVDAGVVTAVQEYLLERDAITDYLTAQNASNLTINTIGTVRVNAAELADVQTRADAAWDAYLSGTKIGSKVVHAELVQALMDAGAVDCEVFITGADVDANNKALGTGEVPVAGDLLSVQLTWETI